MSDHEYKAHIAAVNRATDHQMRQALRQNTTVVGRVYRDGEIDAIKVAAHAAGREAGMREAAGILESYAVNPTCGGRLGTTRIVAIDYAIKAILSAIGTQEDNTSE